MSSPTPPVGLLDVLDDDEIQAAVERIVDHRIRSTPAAPLAARILEVSVEQGHHQRLLDAVLTGLGGFLDDNRVTFRRRLDEESPWWVPESIDDRIFEKIYTAVQRFMDDVGADPQHEVRATIDARLLAFVDRLRNDPELAATAESYKNEVLEHPEVRAWIASLWHEAKDRAHPRGGRARRRVPPAAGRRRSAASATACTTSPSCAAGSTPGSNAACCTPSTTPEEGSATSSPRRSSAGTPTRRHAGWSCRSAAISSSSASTARSSAASPAC